MEIETLEVPSIDVSLVLVEVDAQRNVRPADRKEIEMLIREYAEKKVVPQFAERGITILDSEYRVYYSPTLNAHYKVHVAAPTNIIIGVHPLHKDFQLCIRNAFQMLVDARDYVEVTYSVTLKHSGTGKSVTMRAGDNKTLKSLHSRALAELSRIVSGAYLSPLMARNELTLQNVEDTLLPPQD